MSKISDLDSFVLRALLGNRALASGAFVVGAAAAAVSSTVTIPYIINGVFYSKAAVTSQVLTGVTTTGPLVGGGTYVQPAATTVYYVLALNAAGTLVVTQGSYSGQPLGQPAVYGDGSPPDVQDLTLCPVCVIKVVTAGSTFTLGTTALTGISTFFNIASLPSGLL